VSADNLHELLVVHEIVPIQLIAYIERSMTSTDASFVDDVEMRRPSLNPSIKALCRSDSEYSNAAPL
jgi:hypothetical protein